MPSKKRITPAERRHRDYLRRKTLRVASVYETRLEAARRKELRRVLSMAMDYSDPVALIPLLEGQIDETGYLGKWWQGLIVDAGLPIAKATARDLLQAKAAAEEGIWLTALRNYATTRAGNEIVIVSGTWKDTLVRTVRNILSEDKGLGIEKVAKELYDRYTGEIEKWQCRRIAQTEAMIGMAQAENDAAKTLGIHFTKEWCISGLGNTRPSHEAMDGVTVDEDEPFVLPGGMMMFPHDTSMNADAGEIINCACDCIRRPKNGLAEAPEPQAPEQPEQPAEAPAQETQLTEDQIRENRIKEIMAEMPEDMADDVKRAIAENDLELENKIDITKGAPMSYDKADNGMENPNLSLGGVWRENCQTCTVTHELRRRGFDIEAASWTTYEKVESANKLNWMERFTNIDGSQPTYSKSSKFMSARGYRQMSDKRIMEFMNSETVVGGRYEVYVQWKPSSAHVFLAEKTDKGLKFFDPQTGNHDVSLYLQSKRVKGKGIYILRVDDKLINPKFSGIFVKK